MEVDIWVCFSFSPKSHRHSHLINVTTFILSL